MPTFPLPLGDLSTPRKEVVAVRDVADPAELARLEEVVPVLRKEVAARTPEGTPEPPTHELLKARKAEAASRSPEARRRRAEG